MRLPLPGILLGISEMDIARRVWTGWCTFMAALFAVALLAGVIGLLLARKRRQALEAWATGRGLAFEADKTRGLDQRFALFGCLRKGSNQYAYNVMNGAWAGREVLAFDYHYETYSTDSKGRRRTNHHYFSAAILVSPVPLKPLFIRPEGLWDKIGEFFGLDDIDFESAEFSRKFHVKAPDRKWAYDVLHARTIEFLLSMPRFRIELGGGHGIVYASRTFSVAQFESAIEVLRGIFDRLPEYLIQQQQSQTG